MLGFGLCVITLTFEGDLSQGPIKSGLEGNDLRFIKEEREMNGMTYFWHTQNDRLWCVCALRAYMRRSYSIARYIVPGVVITSAQRLGSGTWMSREA